MKKQLLYIVLCLIVSPVFSQILDKKELQTFNGLFNFYYEEGQDKIYLEVKNLDKLQSYEKNKLTINLFCCISLY